MVMLSAEKRLSSRIEPSGLLYGVVLVLMDRQVAGALRPPTSTHNHSADLPRRPSPSFVASSERCLA